MAPWVTLRESCRMPIAGSRSRTIWRATSTLDRQRHLAERLEDGRQAVSVERVVGDDQRLEAGLGAIDAAEADVAGVAEVDEAADAIPDRRFLVGELRHQLQVFDRVPAGVGDAHARAEPVLERRGGSGGAVARSRQSGHGRLYGCSPGAPRPGAAVDADVGAARPHIASREPASCLAGLGAEIDTNSRHPHGQKVSYRQLPGRDVLRCARKRKGRAPAGAWRRRARRAGALGAGG